jgi:hypothetical protein
MVSFFFLLEVKCCSLRLQGERKTTNETERNKIEMDFLKEKFTFEINAF